MSFYGIRAERLATQQYQIGDVVWKNQVHGQCTVVWVGTVKQVNPREYVVAGIQYKDFRGVWHIDDKDFTISRGDWEEEQSGRWITEVHGQTLAEKETTEQRKLVALIRQVVREELAKGFQW
jgi:hypothetical protein